MHKTVEIILDEAAKHETSNAVLWKAPTIAPPGYTDFSSGMSVFPVYLPDGPMEDKVVFYVADTKGETMHVFATQVSLESPEQEVRELVVHAFEEIEKMSVN